MKVYKQNIEEINSGVVPTCIEYKHFETNSILPVNDLNGATYLSHQNNQNRVFNQISEIFQ